MPNDVANKLIPVKDGVAGNPIELHDSRITSTSPTDGDVLVYNSTTNSYENSAPIQSDYKQTDSSSADYIKNAPLVRIYRSLTGTASVTSSPYSHAKWDVTDTSVSAYVDGMVVCVKVPVAGNGSYGTALQINSLGYKPVVYNVNSMIGTRYSVDSVVWAVYNATQTASLYQNASSSSTVTGCWQVMDYDANTTSISNLIRYNGTRNVTADLLRYAIAFRKDETSIVPIHSVAGTGSSANSAVTATTKTMTTESFDPFGEIYYYATNTKITTGNPVALSALYTQKTSVDARYIFNCAKTLTSNRELFLVVDLQSDKSVKLASTPWSQTLPTTNDGHLYILLGYTYSAYQFELYYYHPIYYHDGTALRMYSGDKIPTATSQITNDSGFITSSDIPAQQNVDWNATSGVTEILNKPTIPSEFRTVNGESVEGATDDIKLYDGYVFPNALVDADGNYYSAVVIGDQVWMTDNFRCTKYPDGTDINYGGVAGPSGLTRSDSVGYYYKNASEVFRYGYLYNCTAVLNESSSSDANPSGVQGIAPDGWHVPSKSEVQQLTDYIKSKKRYWASSSDSNSIAKAMASVDGWSTSSVAYTVGNDLSKNNASGFNAEPGGYIISDNYGARSTHFRMVTSTLSENGYWQHIYLNFGRSYFEYISSSLDSAATVRFVSDKTPTQFRAWYASTYDTMQRHFSQKIKGNGTSFGSNDTINIVPGTNISVTADATNDTITIANTYTHPTYQTISETGGLNGTTLTIPKVSRDTNGAVGISSDTLEFKTAPTGSNKVLTESDVSAMVGAMVYQDSVSRSSNAWAFGSGTTHSAANKGDVYIVSSAFTLDNAVDFIVSGKTIPAGSYESGDMIIYNGSSWNVINGENQVSTYTNPLSWGQDVKIATVDGSDIYAKLPSNPNTDYTIYCDTAASTSTKNGVCASSFDEAKQGWYKVYLKNGNTANSSGTAVTLKVNNGTAFPIKLNGNSITTNNLNYSIESGMHDVYFDGSYWYFTRPFKTFPSRAIVSSSSASNVSKYAGTSFPFDLTVGNYPFWMQTANTAGSSQIFVNGTLYENDKIHINGLAYTNTRSIPAGWSYPYFDGTDWWFRNDGVITAAGFSIPNGTSSGFLKANGSVDTNTYLTQHQDISGKANTADLATVAFSGSYNDLSNTPTIPAAQVNSDWNATSGVAKILNKPTLATVATSGSYNDLSNKPTIPAAQVQTDWDATTGMGVLLNKPTLATVATSGSYNDLTNKPTIPDAQVNSDWNATSGVAKILNKPSLATVATSGSYNDLTNKPTIPAAQVNSDWNATSGVAKILNKPTIPAAQVQTDWNATSGMGVLLNKPTLATVATSGSYNDLTNKPTIPTDHNQTIIVGNTTFAADDAVALAGGNVVSLSTANQTITINHDVPSGADVFSLGENNSGTVSFGGNFSVPTFKTDAYGHVIGASDTTLTLPSNPNTDEKVTPVALGTTATINYNILLANNSTTPTTNGKPNYSTAAKINGKGEITASKIIIDSTSTNILLANGNTLPQSTFALSGHDHSGVYQPVGNYKTTQTAVSDPTASSTTSTTFIDSISQNANGEITVTKKTLPAYLSSFNDSSNYAFKTAKVKTQSTATSNVTGASSDTSLTATSNTDTLNLASGNKWIQINGDTSTKTATFGHIVGTIATTGGNLKKILWDEAGHITATSDAGLSDLNDVKISGRLNNNDHLVYDSTLGKWIPTSVTDSDTIAMVYCDTAAGTQAKIAKCTDFVLKSPSYMMVTIKNANSYNGKITLNINSTGAKDIWINGNVSSSSNKTLPAGTYSVYYESNIYYFRTDGKLTINGNEFGNDYTDLSSLPVLDTTNSTALSTDDDEIITGTISLHKVSKTGSYNDLNNKPTIPSGPGTLNTTNTTALDTNASESLSGTVNLHKVAKTGTYSDLIGTPTIPTVPTNVSSFTNDAGYITANDVPQEVLCCMFTTSNNTITCDKTCLEIYTAWSNKKVIIGSKGIFDYYLLFAGTTTAVFYTVTAGGTIKYIKKNDGGTTWTEEEFIIQYVLIGSGTGQNIKTVNSNNILGSGDLSSLDLLPSASSASGGDVLALNSGKTGLQWITPSGGGGASVLNDLSDVNTSSEADKDALVYDNDTSKWVNKTLGAVAFSNSYNDLNNKPTIPTDSGLVHLAGSETITGAKTTTANVYLKSSSISGATPFLWLQRGTTSDNYADWKINADSDGFHIKRSYGGTDTDNLRLTSSNLYVDANVNATSFVMTNGTSSQFLKADGSVDSTDYSDPLVSGIGLGICNTAAATANKEVTLSGYSAKDNGLLAVKFTYDVPANANLVVGSDTMIIYYKDLAISAGIIRANDIALFSLNPTSYAARLLMVDRSAAATVTIYKGTADPNITPPTGAVNGDIYIKTTT